MQSIYVLYTRNVQIRIFEIEKIEKNEKEKV